jgi:hypothetical protein
MTDRWVQIPREMLVEPGEPWFVFPRSQGPLAKLLHDSGVKVHTLDLSSVGDLHDFFAIFRGVVAYPDWAADGWDQLWDVSTEIEGAWGEPRAFIFAGVTDLARRNLPLAFQISSELSDFSDSLSRGGKKLYVIYVGQ